MDTLQAGSKLAAQASLREAAIHAIADRQYHRMQSAMVKAGPVDLPLHAVQDDAHIDSYTVYSTCMQERNGMAWHSSKYYIEPDGEVIVSRTVLEDAALPHMTKGAIEDRCMWLVVKALPNEPDRCRFTLLQHLVWPKDEIGTQEMDVVADALARLKKIPFQFFPTCPG
ncbi:hypothetical protein AC1031_002202 [Aphanomyces cochlioides]|nr:hypothetical protein AC1031_002202 [Aphanomyces cochlioides]